MSGESSREIRKPSRRRLKDFQRSDVGHPVAASAQKLGVTGFLRMQQWRHPRAVRRALHGDRGLDRGVRIVALDGDVLEAKIEDGAHVRIELQRR